MASVLRVVEIVVANFLRTSALANMTGTVGTVYGSVITVASYALVSNTVPDWLAIIICPTVPSLLGNSTISLSSPSVLALPATCVPLTPIVNTGVVTFIASEPVLAICPDTKEKLPSNTLAFIDPTVGFSGSYTKSSIVMVLFGSTDIVVSSAKAIPTEVPPALITSSR